MKTVLISGGSRGIGRACVELLSKKGYRVAFLYRANDGAASALAERCGAYAIKADVSDSYEVRRAVAEVRERFGGIYALVNNAGVSLIGLMQDTTDAEWRRVIDTNLSGAFYLCREIAPMMIGEKCGRIVNIGSIWGRCGGSCEVAYSASKAALRGLTTSMAKELGPSGITVNCVEPGVIMTDMNACFDEETLNSLKEETPLCRLGAPEDVAETVAFLISDGSSFITGQCIGVDGGMG